jgi:hypothetical protein
MKSLIRSTLKAGLIWAVVGALFALAAPYLAAAMNIPAADIGVIASPKWLAPFFGGTAALAAALEPAYAFLFGGDKARNDAASSSQEKSAAREVHITMVQSRHPSDEQAVISARYQQSIEAERLAPEIQRAIRQQF